MAWKRPRGRGGWVREGPRGRGGCGCDEEVNGLEMRHLDGVLRGQKGSDRQTDRQTDKDE